MKKFLYIFIFLLLSNYLCVAQTESRSEKIEALKIAFITKELNLSPEEAQRFWPVYNNYTQELKKVRLENQQDVVTFEENVVNIRKKYKPEFRRVLNADDRVNRIFVTENNFIERLRAERQRRQELRRTGPGGKTPQ